METEVLPHGAVWQLHFGVEWLEDMLRAVCNVVKTTSSVLGWPGVGMDASVVVYSGVGLLPGPCYKK